jgi:hypothetical protein
MFSGKAAKEFRPRGVLIGYVEGTARLRTPPETIFSSLNKGPGPVQQDPVNPARSGRKQR